MRQRRNDPLDTRLPLEWRGRHFPLGFPLDLATNSRDVVEAAEEAWAGQRQAFDSRPLTMRVVVRPEGELAPAGAYRKMGHLLAVSSDRDNFATVDLREQFAFVTVSQKTASDHAWLRWFFVESLAYLMLCQRQIAMVHAAFVAREDRGVLLCGASGAGKSTLAYACARAGWTYLADDTTTLLPDSIDRSAIGRPRQVRFRPDAPRLFPEVERFLARARPTGKIAIEVPTAALGIRTAERATVAAVLFLERCSGSPAAERITGGEAVERLIADLPLYGGEVDELHERTIGRLAAAPAYVLRYESIEDGVGLVFGI